MANFVQLDKNRRKLYLRKLQKRVILKEKIKQKDQTKIDILNAQFLLQKMPRNSLGVRIKKRCALTGRGKGLTGPFNISRIKLRDLVSKGLVPGVKKGIW
tara:strand:+ start:1619 stop:1918 length:300 start_codon:yes stop_codon:yes gene_type:complete